MGGGNSDPGDGARDTGGRSLDAGSEASGKAPSPASPASPPPAQVHPAEVPADGSPPSPAATSDSAGDFGAGDSSPPSTAGSAGSAGDVGAVDKTRSVPLVAPPWTGRVYYLVGGTLPATYSAWVSHDLTAPGWRRRQAARTGLLLLPVACVFALLPGPVTVRATIVAFIAATALGLGFGAGGYFRNRRLLQHGFLPVFAKTDDGNIDGNIDGNGNGNG
jgi:hypothetical protein